METDTIFIVALNSTELNNNAPGDKCAELAKVIDTKYKHYDVSIITKDIEEIDLEEFKDLFVSKLNKDLR